MKKIAIVTVLLRRRYEAVSLSEICVLRSWSRPELGPLGSESVAKIDVTQLIQKFPTSTRPANCISIGGIVCVRNGFPAEVASIASSHHNDYVTQVTSAVDPDEIEQLAPLGLQVPTRHLENANDIQVNQRHVACR